MWKNAFSSPESLQEHSVLIEKIAKWVVTRRLAMPALLLLESCKPLNRIFGQSIVIITPFAAFFSIDEMLKQFSDLLQSRENVEKLTEKIENLENLRLMNR